MQRFLRVVAATAIALSGAACTGDGTAAPATTIAETTVPATTIPSTTFPTTVPPTTVSPTTATAPSTSTASTPASSSPVATEPATTAPEPGVDVRVYFLRDERLVIAHRDVKAPAVLRGAVEALLAGPDANEAARGLTSTIPAGTTLLGVDLDDGEATIDLDPSFGSGGGTLSMTARIAQVVFTATQFPNVDRVRFRIDGEPVDALGGEGIVLTEPQRRMDVARELSGSVIVDQPQPGATVTSPIRVTGEGDVYEAQFPIEIWRDGVQIGGLAPVTAGAWGTWGSFDVEIPVDAAPGPIQIVTYDEGGCGTGPECPPIIRTVVDVVLA